LNRARHRDNPAEEVFKQNLLTIEQIGGKSCRIPRMTFSTHVADLATFFAESVIPGSVAASCCGRIGARQMSFEAHLSLLVSG